MKLPEHKVFVSKYSRAGKGGKPIYCPICTHSARVYHFSWSAITCSYCKRMVNKKEWFLSPL